jgi:uncharacterized protein
LLLRLAHRSIEAAVEERELELLSPSEHLAECRGAFTTLHLHGKLRGCIGYVFPTSPLYRTVAETARAAALDDPRFHPVNPEEVMLLKVEISVLSPLRPIAPDEIVIGKHGLVVTSRQPPRTSLAPSPCGMELERRDISGPDLPEGRIGPGCLALWR